MAASYAPGPAQASLDRLGHHGASTAPKRLTAAYDFFGLRGGGAGLKVSPVFRLLPASCALVGSLLLGSGCVESKVVLTSMADAAQPLAEGDAADVPDAAVAAEDSAVDAGSDSAPRGPSGCGSAGVECAADEFCEYEAACGGENDLGTCVKRPGTCNTVAPCLNPVCGCNGLSYCEPCFARQAGTAIKAPGPC